MAHARATAIGGKVRRVAETQEFGVRMALGASAGQVRRAAAGEGLCLTAIGGIAGFAAAAAVGVGLRDPLYDVAPLDATTLAAAAAVVAATASAAVAHPAWRAAHIDPALTLRAEQRALRQVAVAGCRLQVVGFRVQVAGQPAHPRCAEPERSPNPQPATYNLKPAI